MKLNEILPSDDLYTSFFPGGETFFLVVNQCVLSPCKSVCFISLHMNYSNQMMILSKIPKSINTCTSTTFCSDGVSKSAQSQNDMAIIASIDYR